MQCRVSSLSPYVGSVSGNFDVVVSQPHPEIIFTKKLSLHAWTKEETEISVESCEETGK